MSDGSESGPPPPVAGYREAHWFDYVLIYGFLYGSFAFFLTAVVYRIRKELVLGEREEEQGRQAAAAERARTAAAASTEGAATNKKKARRRNRRA